MDKFIESKIKYTMHQLVSALCFFLPLYQHGSVLLFFNRQVGKQTGSQIQRQAGRQADRKIRYMVHRQIHRKVNKYNQFPEFLTLFLAASLPALTKHIAPFFTPPIPFSASPLPPPTYQLHLYPSIPHPQGQQSSELRGLELL